MKLQKAIDYGTLISTNLKGALGYEGVDALKLLIEAGKREMDCREGEPPVTWDLLPGETKEVFRGMTETMFINPETD